MVDIVNYIRNIIGFPNQNRKRRASIDQDNFIVPKIRKINVSQMSNNYEDDLHSTSLLWNKKYRNNLSKPNSKENITVTIDDDDDVMEVSKIKSQFKKPDRLQYTSTPTSNFSVAPRLSLHNGDDDIKFVKCSPSVEEKGANAKRRGFEYMKPFSYLGSNQNKYRGIQNGGTKSHEIGSILNNSEVKSNYNQHRKSAGTSAANHSIRLDEKLKYSQLLARAAPNYSFIPKSFERILNFGKTSVQKNKSSEHLPSNGRLPRSMSTRETIMKVLDAPISIKDLDSDVEILPTPPSPKPDIKVERVNSIKKIVDTSEHTSNKWLTERIDLYKNRVANFERDIKNEIAQQQKLSALTSEIYTKRLEDKMVKCLQIKNAILPEFVPTDALPELSDEDEAFIDHAINKRENPNEILVQKFGLNITRRDMLTLSGFNWLNDEVINFYMNLLIERGKDSKWPKIYAMNTFFYPKLLKTGPSSLRRWTRRIDIFSYDIIAVPIHLGIHWCMSIINFKNCTIKYYDSMGSSNNECLDALLNYLQIEHLDKKETEYDISNWTLENVKNIPQQMNGSDCGMFACTFAEFLTRNAKITFSQEDMPYLRRKMILEILNGELLIK